MTEKHERSPEFGGLLSQHGMSTTEVSVILGSVLVALGFLQNGSESVLLAALLEEGHAANLVQLWRSREETVVLGIYRPRGPEA